MDQFLRVLGWAASVLLVIGGIAGIVIPVLPGTLMVLAGLVLAAALDSFERVGWGTLGVLAALSILSYGMDLGASILGARHMKASREAMIGAGLGTVVGLFFGFVGIVFGPLLGALAGELLSKMDLVQAGKVGLGTWIGMLVSTVFRLFIVCVMLGIFLLSYVF
jgi:uncharacterized protein YqgC (DUF456 family)